MTSKDFGDFLDQLEQALENNKRSSIRHFILHFSYFVPVLLFSLGSIILLFHFEAFDKILHVNLGHMFGISCISAAIIIAIGIWCINRHLRRYATLDNGKRIAVNRYTNVKEK